MYRTDSINSESVNLWTGGRKTNQETLSKFEGASLKVKVSIWESSEIKSHFLVPVFGGPGGLGLVWSRDPVMVFPKFFIAEEGFNLNTGISFVANSNIAITGKMSFSRKEDSSTVGLGGGIVYRQGEYDGVRISASLKRGSSTRASLEIGLSYGQKKD